MVTVFIQCLLIIFIYATLWFLVALYKKRNDVADIAWGIGYIIICGFLFYKYPASAVLILLYALVTIWGLRLSLHIYIRNKNKTEDYRYKAWRDEWGKSFYWRSYLQVFLLQGFFLLIILSPVIHAAVEVPYTWNIYTWIGLLCWMIGFYFQVVGDWQLAVFIKNRKTPGAFIQTGLWKYSRHPNYFGEILMWWGIFMITIPFANSFYFIAGPLTITLLLVFVSGIPMLEKKYTGNKAFEDYKKRISVLIPLPPRKV
jgi:steroid 5-alpha reductase family enzyme